MDLGLKGKTVIVTGSGSNIGRGIALGFAQEGCNVVVAEWDETQGQKVAQAIEALGAKALMVPTDITNNDQVQAMVEKTLATFGQIDILVNNAGRTGGDTFVQKPREVCEQEININLWGPLNCLKAVIPHMMERKAGAIVNISSDSGRVGETGQSIYSACKAGVIGLTKTLAKELGRSGIRVNVVSPGLTLPSYEPGSEETGEQSVWKNPVFSDDMLKGILRYYPLKKVGRPSDIADAVLFLSSDRAGHITGQTLSVDGGFCMI